MIRTFRKHYDLIQGGLLYRLSTIQEDTYEAWQFAAEDKRRGAL